MTRCQVNGNTAGLVAQEVRKGSTCQLSRSLFSVWVPLSGVAGCVHQGRACCAWITFHFQSQFSHSRVFWENGSGITEIKNVGLQIRRVGWLQVSNKGPWDRPLFCGKANNSDFPTHKLKPKQDYKMRGRSCREVNMCLMCRTAAGPEWLASTQLCFNIIASLGSVKICGKFCPVYEVWDISSRLYSLAFETLTECPLCTRLAYTRYLHYLYICIHFDYCIWAMGLFLMELTLCWEEGQWRGREEVGRKVGMAISSIMNVQMEKG